MPHSRPAADTRKPYSGPARSLVIAIDVGTTFSGVSYAILEPGEIPKIHGVTRFPGQEHVAGNTKIPSVIYYDKHGKMMAAGAEADSSAIQAQAEDEAWIKAELFKLRLRPRTMQLNMNGMRLGPLPKRKTAVHVFGDFLAYLYRCTRNFISDTHANGGTLWNQVEGDIQFVLSHPNGWEGAQQSKMRRAAIYGGLIPDTNEGKARIRFVTEGEASLHACVLNGLAADVLSNPSKHGFLIADAGGGTLDISAYAIKGAKPLVIEEIAPPDCIFAGSVFVSRRAREFLEEKLKKSKYGTPDALDHITRRFDETTKRLFRDRRDLQFIPFGSPLDKDPSVGIRGGQLKLTGQEVADLFEPSVQAAVRAIRAQIEASQGMIRSVFLVGGYAASPWLFGQLQERLAPYKVVVSRPDTQTSKAVADGAIGFYCDHHVSARMSKFMYGVEFLREMDPRDPDHVARQEKLCELPSGPKLLPDAFDCILARSLKVKESMVFTRKYCTELTSLSMLSVFEVEIWCYRGGNTVPKWINRQAEDFSTLCVVRADLSPLAGSAEPKAGRSGTYWTIVFSVEIQFGLTEFKARIKWVDNGVTRYGPASIIYNERGHRADEDEPDVFPEDDINTASVSTTPRSATDRIRSEPVSRARTPVADPYSHPQFSSSSAMSSRRPSQSISRSEFYANGSNGVPEVARVERERTPSKGQSSPSPPSREYGGGERNGYDEERRRGLDTPPVSSKGKERERDRESSKATPKTNNKIGETLSSVWGPGSQSNAASPRHTSPVAAEPPPPPGSVPRGSSGYGDRGTWGDQQQQPQTPGHVSQRSVSQAQKSPWVETISATIENPKVHSPWDPVPSAVPKSVSMGSGHSGGERERERSEKERMSSLWDDAPRSSYGDPPKSPWGSAKAPSAHVGGGGGGEESTVLLAAEEVPPPVVSRSLSAAGKSPWGANANKDLGVPVDVDDAPIIGGGSGGGQMGWGAAVTTPKSVTSNAPVGDTWDTPAGSKTPKSATGRSRKNSVAASALSKASPALTGSKSPFGALGVSNNNNVIGEEAHPLTGNSPNLLATARSIGGTSPLKRSSPLNPAAHELFSGDSAVPDPSDGGNTFDNWGTTGANDTWNYGDTGNNNANAGASNNNATDSWGFTEEVQPAAAPSASDWNFGTTSPNAPVSNTIGTPKSSGIKTPKGSILKTPKTPAAEAPLKTPITESAPPPPMETPITPEVVVAEDPGTSVVGGSKKKKKKAGAVATPLAAVQAAEEEERKKEQEAEERRRREEEEAAARAEAERIAKEEEEALERELAEMEAKAKAEQEEKEKAAASAASAAAESATAKGKKGKKNKKGSPLDLWNDEEEKGRQAKEEEERLARAKAENEAREREELEASERAEREAKEKEEREKEEREAKEREEREAKEKEEREAKEREENAAAEAFAPAKGKKKKGKKGTPMNMWEDEDEKEKEREKAAKEEEERAAREKAEQEAKEKEERERAEAEAKEKEKAEKEAKEKEAENTGSSSIFGFGSGGWGSTSGSKSGTGWGGVSDWSSKAKAATPSIKSAFGGWGGVGGSTFGSSFGSAFGVGDTDAKTEEIKLDSVGDAGNLDTISFGEPLSLSLSANPPAASPKPTSALDVNFDTVETAATKTPSRPASRAASPIPLDTNAPAAEEATNAETPHAETPTAEAPAEAADDDWGGVTIKTKKKKGKGGAAAAAAADDPPTPAEPAAPKEDDKPAAGGAGGKKKKKGKK